MINDVEDGDGLAFAYAQILQKLEELSPLGRNHVGLILAHRLAEDVDVSQRKCSFFFFSSRRRHTRLQGDWSSDVCSSDLRMNRDSNRASFRWYFDTSSSNACLSPRWACSTSCWSSSRSSIRRLP